MMLLALCAAPIYAQRCAGAETHRGAMAAHSVQVAQPLVDAILTATEPKPKKPKAKKAEAVSAVS